MSQISKSGYDVAYDYDTTGRMNAVTWDSGNKTAIYTYVPDSDLLDTLTMGNLETDYAYEPNRNLKTQVKHKYNGNAFVQYDYTYNAIAQRDHLDITTPEPEPITLVEGEESYKTNSLNQYYEIS